jgi:hypothetical protein
VALLGFPNPVNELAARTVAAGVLLASAATTVLGVTLGSAWLWLVALLFAGFVARVLTGPTLSPLGRLAAAVIAPRLGPARPVPGPPKRFAQAIGAVVTGLGSVFQAVGLHPLVYVVLAVMMLFALLESGFGLCAGCAIFGWLMRRGVIPADICAECANVSLRLSQPA